LAGAGSFAWSGTWLVPPLLARDAVMAASKSAIFFCCFSARGLSSSIFWRACSANDELRSRSSDSF
jgi:hypothetical protein